MDYILPSKDQMEGFSKLQKVGNRLGMCSCLLGLHGTDQPSQMCGPPYTTPYVYSSTDWGGLVTTEEGWNPNAASWFQTSLVAGGSWTWNLPRQSNDKDNFFLLHPNHLAVVAYAASHVPSSTLSASISPSNIPVEGPTGCREDGNDLFYKGEEGGNRPCKMLLKAKEKKGQWMLDLLCAQTESSTYGPPSEVYKVSCNTCPGGCGESSTRRFYYKML